jgi:hypothetical protein
MKPRARRVTIAAAVLGGAVVVVLVVAHWDTVRDHVEAWHFQLTRKTATVLPARGGWLLAEERTWRFDRAGCLLVLATYSGLPVMIDSAVDNASAFVITNPDEDPSMWTLLTEAKARRHLQENGWRILEQRTRGNRRGPSLARETMTARGGIAVLRYWIVGIRGAFTATLPTLRLLSFYLVRVPSITVDEWFTLRDWMWRASGRFLP